MINLHEALMLFQYLNSRLSTFYFLDYNIMAD